MNDQDIKIKSKINNNYICSNACVTTFDKYCVFFDEQYNFTIANLISGYKESVSTFVDNLLYFNCRRASKYTKLLII